MVNIARHLLFHPGRGEKMIDGTDLPYADTKVSLEKSKAEIDHLLRKFGCRGIQGAWLDDEENELRDRTLKAYAETGDKAPAEGVGIREVTKLEYDTKVAFDWAVEHTMAIKLDVSAFEKIAKVSPPNFVTVFQEPQATIATNLG